MRQRRQPCVVDNDSIRKVHANGAVTTLAGSPGLSDYQDGVGATARFNSPQGLAADRFDNLYVADCENHCIRKITPDGIVTTLTIMLCFFLHNSYRMHHCIFTTSCSSTLESSEEPTRRAEFGGETRIKRAIDRSFIPNTACTIPINARHASILYNAP